MAGSKRDVVTRSLRVYLVSHKAEVDSDDDLVLYDSDGEGNFEYVSLRSAADEVLRDLGDIGPGDGFALKGADLAVAEAAVRAYLDQDLTVQEDARASDLHQRISEALRAASASSRR